MRHSIDRSPLSLLLATTCSLATFGVACGKDDDRRPAATAGPITASAGSSGGSLSSGGSSAMKFDVPQAPEGTGDGSETPMICQKVDFLFVVDNSHSMRDEQENLIRSFPKFIAAMQATVEATDYNIMVVDTDGAPVSNECVSYCQKNPQGTCKNEPCAEAGRPDASQCDNTLGAGRTRSSDGMDCAIPGRRYMKADDPNLATSFPCAGRVGTSGNTKEKQVEAALRAISPELNAAGGCNEGFNRKDAVLVIVWLTDESDNDSEGLPRTWFETLVAAKGFETNIVPLAIIGDTGLPNAVCQRYDDQAGTGADNAVEIRDLLKRFTYGIPGNVCVDDYSPFLIAAVEQVQSACQGYRVPR